MIRYILLSKKLIGYIDLGFDKKTGLMLLFQICIYNVLVNTHRHLLEKGLPFWLTKDQFNEWAKTNGYDAIHEETDLSFERFWDEYGVARNRIPAEKLWKKMNDGDRAYVFYNLAAYKRYCKRNEWYTQMYPDTYLRGHWQDEWDKLITANEGK